MTLVQNMALSNIGLRVEIHGHWDHHWSHFVIWATTSFVLLNLYIVITFLLATMPSCYLLAMQKVREDFVIFLATY